MVITFTTTLMGTTSTLSTHPRLQAEEVEAELEGQSVVQSAFAAALESVIICLKRINHPGVILVALMMKMSLIN